MYLQPSVVDWSIASPMSLPLTYRLRNEMEHGRRGGPAPHRRGCHREVVRDAAVLRFPGDLCHRDAETVQAGVHAGKCRQDGIERYGQRRR
jgi:hypothetical protein